VHWLIKNRKEDNITKEKCERHLEAIHKDLNLDKLNQGLKPGEAGFRELIVAPEVDPVNPDFSYQKKYPWMMNPQSCYTHISVEEQNIRRNKEKREKKKGQKQHFYLFTLSDEDLTDQNAKSFSSSLISSDKLSSLDLEKGIVVRKIRQADFKGKPCFLLSEENNENENQTATAMFKKNFGGDRLHGTVHILTNKAFHQDPSTEEGEVSIVKQSPKQPKETKEEKQERIHSQINSLLISKEELKKDEKIELVKSPKKRQRKGNHQ
jgi:hypothetical protein